MSFEFKFPDVGEGITEGTIVKWRVKEGDTVKVDQIIADIETDKAVVEVPTPKAGKVLKINSKAGDVVKVGSVLIVIGESGEKVEEKKEEPTPQEEKKDKIKELKKVVEEKKGSVGVVGSLPEYEEPKEKVSEKEKKEELKSSLKKTFTAKEVKALPAVRKLAKEKNIDLSTIEPTGEKGEITKDDIESATGGEAPKLAKAGVKITKREYDLYGYTETVPMKGVRKIIAEHMVESHTKTAPVTAFDEADVSHLWEIRQKEKTGLAKKGITLTFLPFVMKSCIAALKMHPYLNAGFDDEKNAVILKEYYNMGFAVDTPDGLIVPVLKIADGKTIQQIAEELSKLSEATRSRKINLGDLKGGTFTITNIGSIGGQFGTPIINYPETAILLTGRIYDKPLAIDGEIKIRKVLPLSLTFDHRVTDGAEAQRFMNDLISYLEDPDKLLLDFK